MRRLCRTGTHKGTHSERILVALRRSWWWLCLEFVSCRCGEKIRLLLQLLLLLGRRKCRRRL